jgi:molecular chaperone GrpE (heat shock protein)
MQMASDTVAAGHVVDVVENGYTLGDKVLRPAKVVVSQGKAEENTQE